MSTQNVSKINWKSVGNADSNNTIVFLHEGLGCVEMWKDYPQKLCERLNVRGIIYDRAGYGKSDGSLTDRDHLYLHHAANELNQFLKAINIEKPILYGHSDGGSIALIYAAKYGNSKAIITEAAHVFNEPETIKGVQAARPLLKEGKMDGLKKYHGSKYKEVFYAWNDIWLDESFKDWNITSLLPNITVPQLIIQGTDDQYGTLKQVEFIEKLTVGHTITFVPKNCGHAPFKERTDAVLEKVIQFITPYVN